MTTAAPLGPSTSDVPPPSTAPRLSRSGTDRMLGGVSGGLAEYTGIDVVLWRVAFVALALLGGSGVLFYLVLWVLMPSAPLGPDTAQSPLDRLADRLNVAVRQALGRRDQRS
jgi:phage shock protein PspC (stress-responsive transcriptional regulator)